MKKLLLALVVLAVLLVAGDRVAEQVAEGVLAGQLEADVGSRPDVEVDGFPFLTQALRGRYDRLRLQADRVDRAGVVLEDVRASLRGARVPLSDAVQGTVAAVPVDGLTTSGLVSYDALEVLAAREVQLEPDGDGVRVSGTVTVLGQDVPASALSSVELDGDTLRITARQVELGGDAVGGQVSGSLSGRLDLQLPLPALPFDLALTSVQPGPRGVTVTGSAEDTVLRR